MTAKTTTRKTRFPSVGRQVQLMLYQHKGIGESKKESRQESGLKSAENNHKVSNKIHSIKTLQHQRNTMTNLGRFAKEKFGMKDMSKINANVVKDWINSKGIQYNSASDYLSEVNRMTEHLSITRVEVKELRKDFKEKLPKSNLQHRAYKGLEKIELPEKFQPAFELQRDYGLRAGAAIRIDLKNLNNNNILKIRQKGGRETLVKINKPLALKIRENAILGRYEVKKDTYASHLKKEIEKSGQIFNGSHGIRHAFAQLKAAQGYSMGDIAIMMGHTREEIVNTYFR